MRKVVPKEGPRAPLFYFGLGLALLAGNAGAQVIEQAELDRCARLATAEARLACFEALARGEDGESGASPESTPSAEAAVESVPATVTESVAATTPADEESGSEPDARQAPARQQGIPEDFGKAVEDEYVQETITATVVNVETGRNKVLYFHFANGQVWRQIEGRRFSYPKNRAFDVEITTGIMGDYRLRSGSGGPMTRIRRIQ